jgi:hypothetical protein
MDLMMLKFLKMIKRTLPKSSQALLNFSNIKNRDENHDISSIKCFFLKIKWAAIYLLFENTSKYQNAIIIFKFKKKLILKLKSINNYL